MIKDTNYFTVCGWMRTRLHLKGNDLIVYAVVNSFSQDGKSEYKGSNSYLADFTGAGERTISRILADLEKRKLIEKTNDNASTGQFNGWKIVPIERLEELGLIPKEGDSQNGDPPSPEWQPPDSQNGSPTVAKMATPTNKVDNNISHSNLRDINLDTYKERKKEVLEKTIKGAVDFSQMSDEELLTYGERFIDGIDMTSSTDWEAWLAYDAELKKRGAARKTGEWKGKIVVNENGRIERLKSYAEVIAEWGFSKAVVSALDDFIQHCLLNKQRLTNEKLNDICFRLCDLDNDDLRLDQIKRAIKFGYYDIAAESAIETALRLSRQILQGRQDGNGVGQPPRPLGACK